MFNCTYPNISLRHNTPKTFATYVCSRLRTSANRWIRMVAHRMIISPTTASRVHPRVYIVFYSNFAVPLSTTTPVQEISYELRESHRHHPHTKALKATFSQFFNYHYQSHSSACPHSHALAAHCSNSFHAAHPPRSPSITESARRLRYSANDKHATKMQSPRGDHPFF